MTTLSEDGRSLWQEVSSVPTSLCRASLMRRFSRSLREPPLFFDDFENHSFIDCTSPFSL